MPIEFPNQLLLSVNRKTAGALGATPIARADEVIEWIGMRSDAMSPRN